MIKHLNALGFSNVIHENRDFYKDVKLSKVPDYDILITNPPYSGDNKEKCVEYAAFSEKPWLLLLPNYVATKEYFTRTFADFASPCFVVPNTAYEYDHPKQNTVRNIMSIWICGFDNDVNQAAQSWSQKAIEGCALCHTVKELKDNNYVSAPEEKRLNPRRRKLLAAAEAEAAN